MRYLSIDLEATGLRENDYMIELAFAPFDTDQKSIAHDLSFHTFVQCPSFDELKESLDPWVIEHNQTLIERAHQSGVKLNELPLIVKNYLEQDTIRNYFHNEKIIIFGKSLNALDLPFLNRDLGWDFMRRFFSHKVLDLSSIAFHLIDSKQLPSDHHGSSELMSYFQMGDVAHTALEDAQNCALLYLKILEKFSIE